MDFVLVFPLILAFQSIGQSYTEFTAQKADSCYEMCPPGYYKDGDCNNGSALHTCKQCVDGTFTHSNNTVKKCFRCRSCSNYEVEIKPCSFNSNVVCKCQEKYYYSNKSQNCLQCQCEQCKDFDKNPDLEMCSFCQWKECLEIPECNRKCTASTPSISTAPTATTATSMTSTSALNNTSNPDMNPVPQNLKEMLWLLLVLVVVTLLVLLWFVLFIRNPFINLDKCLCWSMNKDLEPPVKDPKFNEQSRHQGSSPNTLSFTISEETPMMTLSQRAATPGHPAHISPLLADTEHKDGRQNEPSDRWPAIVLYAIIKEVPLRRWKEFLRLLSVADQQLERVELEAGLGLGFMERQYQMLRLWSQRSSASLNDVFSALRYMDLSGCAQLLQENLDKLQWKA